MGEYPSGSNWKMYSLPDKKIILYMGYGYNDDIHFSATYLLVNKTLSFREIVQISKEVKEDDPERNDSSDEDKEDDPFCIISWCDNLKIMNEDYCEKHKAAYLLKLEERLDHSVDSDDPLCITTGCDRVKIPNDDYCDEHKDEYLSWLATCVEEDSEEEKGEEDSKSTKPDDASNQIFTTYEVEKGTFNIYFTEKNGTPMYNNYDPSSKYDIENIGDGKDSLQILYKGLSYYVSLDDTVIKEFINSALSSVKNYEEGLTDIIASYV